MDALKWSNYIWYLNRKIYLHPFNAYSPQKVHAYLSMCDLFMDTRRQTVDTTLIDP